MNVFIPIIILSEFILRFLNFALCECVPFLWNPIRLKRRRQLKQSQSEKSVNEQNQVIISCPNIPNDNAPKKETDLPKITSKPSAGSGKSSIKNSGVGM